MPAITTKDGVEIFYKDWGKGQPVVFSHGWPLSSDDWDAQMLFFLNNGYRVIAHDRRGHGRSAQVSVPTFWLSSEAKLEAASALRRRPCQASIT